MAPGAQVWWTDERVDETVTSSYVYSHLRTNEQEILKRPLFGGDLTDDTYLDWILTKAKRFFLILVATGLPDQIFGIVDDSYDDEDLPIAEELVPELRLSLHPDHSLDRRFYKTQFRFLTRIIGDGEHIRYADEETVPVLPLGLKSVIGISKDGSDTVKLPSDLQKVFVRKRVVLDSRSSEKDALAEIAGMKKFSHEHVISVFGSYLHQDTLSILFSPAAEYTLKHFLTDIPKAFEVFSKSERRRTLITWPHCLANALAWLHGNDGHHGAIRPSNIHVNQNFHISLGFLDGDGLICQRARSDDIEAYQYAAPERWKRAVTVQSTGSSTLALPSGGRSTHQPRLEKWYTSDQSSGRQSASGTKASHLDITGAAVASYAFLPTSKSNFARLRLSTAVNKDFRSSSSHHSTKNTLSDETSIISYGTMPHLIDPGLSSKAASITSSRGEDARRLTVKSPAPTAFFVVAPESRTAVVQTWRSVEHDSFAADIFSIGSVIMDILTVICKRTYSSFARHRSAKNRNAGRGGGLADASFHANLGQVQLWGQAISSEAEKKAKKDDSRVLYSVGPIVQIAMQCLEKSPEARLNASTLAQKLGEHIQKFANIDALHCTVGSKPEKERSHSKLELGRKYGDNLPKSVSNSKLLPTLPTPDASVSSFASFNFELDGQADTIVANTPSSHNDSWHVRQYQDPKYLKIPSKWHDQESDHQESRSWQYYHQNDSAVDPTLTSSDAGDSGTFTYINYSTGTSSDEDEGDPYTYPHPPTQAPNRKLPPLPRKNNEVSRNKKILPSIAHGPLSEVAMLQNTTKATNGGHTIRTSSLRPKDINRDNHHNSSRQTRRVPILQESPLPKAGHEKQRVY